MVTLPDVEAVTIPARLKLFAVRLIRPPLEAIRSLMSSDLIPTPDWFNVMPVIVNCPVPLDMTFAEFFR